MDAQLKRGMLDICVLSAIKNKESYGYQIIKDIGEYVKISESTLYPILRRLETANYLTVRTAEHSGRLRKYYMITNYGKEQLIGLDAAWDELAKGIDIIRNGSKA